MLGKWYDYVCLFINNVIHDLNLNAPTFCNYIDVYIDFSLACITLNKYYLSFHFDFCICPHQSKIDKHTGCR